MEGLSLKQAVDVLQQVRHYRICVHDVSGILTIPQLMLPVENTMHSMRFCSLAKDSAAGFRSCVRCKNISNHRAIFRQKVFSGLCAFGMKETVWPVVIDGKTMCILYLGNIVQDRQASEEKLAAACHTTGSLYEAMRAQMDLADTQTDETTAEAVCRLLDGVIRLLYNTYKDTADIKSSPYHWAVVNIKNYMEENYSRNLTLESICRLYFINEKYAGQLFKSQLGMSFHTYLNRIRLRRAAQELQNSRDKIIDIALRCGFNNVTYFNRRFSELYGMSPREYRRKP